MQIVHVFRSLVRVKWSTIVFFFAGRFLIWFLGFFLENCTKSYVQWRVILFIRFNTSKTDNSLGKEARPLEYSTCPTISHSLLEYDDSDDRRCEFANLFKVANHKHSSGISFVSIRVGCTKIRFPRSSFIFGFDPLRKCMFECWLENMRFGNKSSICSFSWKSAIVRDAFSYRVIGKLVLTVA